MTYPSCHGGLMKILRVQDTLGRFSTLLNKGVNFCESYPSTTNPFWKWVYSKRSKFFPFRVDPFQKGSKLYLKELLPLKLHQFPLIWFINIWATAWENVPSDICAKRRLKLACSSAQSDQNIRCPHDDTLHPWLSKMRPRRILMHKLILIFAGRKINVWRYVFWRMHSFHYNWDDAKIQLKSSVEWNAIQ